MFKSSFTLLLTVFTLMAMTVGEGLCQSYTATIHGTVKDPSAAVLPGVSMTARNTGTTLTRTAVTNEIGNYIIPLLPVGTYEVTAELPGFKSAVRSPVLLQVDERVRVDFSLEIGEITEKLVVTEAAPLLESTTANIGNVIEERKILELPLNGREFFQLAQLNPNVVPPAQGSTLGFRGGFNVAGNSEIANNYILDGVDNNDETTNQPTLRPSIEAIREFKVLTGTYSAEYGRNSGGQVIVATKSGTNQFHGSVFEFHRNSALDARNFFTPGKIPPLRRNQFGFAAGGPILPNKTFFFGNYEGLRLGEQVARVATVPTLKMRQGDFSELSTAIRDPQTGRPFPGNVIPQDRIHPISRGLLEFYPLPTLSTTTRNLPNARTRVQDLDQFTIKIDHQLSAAHTLAGSYHFIDRETFEPSNPLCGSRELPGFGCLEPERTQVLSLVLTSVISSNAVNEFRAGYNRLRTNRFQEDRDVEVVRRLGIKGLPGIDVQFPASGGIPQFSITGFSTLGLSTNLPQGRTDNTYNWIDNLTYTHKSHTFKGGADIRRFRFNSFNVAGIRGSFAFDGRFSGNALADFLLGRPRQTSRNPGVPFSQTYTTSANFYFQDDWKVTPNLTLNLGLRYEYATPVEENNDILASFDPATGRIRTARGGVAFVDEKGQLVFNRGPGGSKRVFDEDFDNFAPRVGFAYQVPWIKDTVVRGGYGIFYNNNASGNGISALFRGLPFRRNQSFITDPATPLSLSDPFPENLSVASFAPAGVERDFRSPYIQNWSFGLQRQITSTLVADVAYAGSKGTKLPRLRNINQPEPGPGAITPRRPYPQFANIAFRESSAASSFHSLQLRVEQRLDRGLSYLVAYTYSKSIDDSPGIATSSDASNDSPQNTRNLRAERGLSDFDVRNRFVLSLVYDLPFGPGKPFAAGAGNRVLSKLIEGWQLSTITTLQSGRPFTVTVSGDRSNTGANTDRPNLIGDPQLSNRGPERFFNTAAFQLQPQFSFGNVGRNTLTADGFTNFDFSLMKLTSITEQVRAQFRAEFFNIFNNVNFALPNGVVNSPRFGQVSEAAPARQIQFALKILW